MTDRSIRPMPAPCSRRSSVPVEKDSFPERMVALAEDIIKALGETGRALRRDLREILFESAEQIQKS